ncbi:MAG: shikimate kinase [Bacteroidota bacterium]
MKILLLGYMASGKSTIAKNIGENLDLQPIDLDDYIEDNEGCSIKDIFKNKGEIYFRKKENFYLNELIISDKDFVLALGGGTPCYANNIDLITKNGISIYLKASLQTLYDRLVVEKTKRPLISDLSDKKLKEFIAKHLFERAPFYERAQHTIVIDGKTTDEITKEILGLI